MRGSDRSSPQGRTGDSKVGTGHHRVGGECHDPHETGKRRKKRNRELRLFACPPEKRAADGDTYEE